MIKLKLKKVVFWIIFVVSAVTAAMIFSTVTLYPNSGFYFMGFIRCHDRYSCLHEIGHAIDSSSDGDEYKNAVDLYIQVQWQLPPQKRDPYWSWRIANFPGFGTPLYQPKSVITRLIYALRGGWGGYDELYASMFAWADADISKIPEPFQRFYDPASSQKQLRKLGMQ